MPRRDINPAAAERHSCNGGIVTRHPAKIDMAQRQEAHTENKSRLGGPIDAGIRLDPIGES
jgi:hypothetical protein